MKNLTKKEIIWLVLMIIGLAMIVSAVVWFGNIPDDDHYLSRISGVLCGVGGGLLGISAAKFIGSRMATPEQARRKEIEQRDERNIQVSRAAMSVVAASAFIILAAMSLLFTFMDLHPADIICSSAIGLLLIIYVVAFNRLNKKM